MSQPENRRILVIDDNASIQADYRKILGDGRESGPAGSEARAAFFGEPAPAATPAPCGFELESAYQGEEGLARVREALAAKRPYALAFVDVRMPPGLDGVETASQMFALDPELQIVLCTAFADYTWEDLGRKLGKSDRLLILKKPFDPIEVVQLATALSEKWNSARRERQNLAEARRAEMEARAYAASIATVNHALEAAHASAEATSTTKFEFLGRLAAVLQESSTALHASLELACEPGQSPRGQQESLETASARCAEICNTARNLALQSSLDLNALQPAHLPYSPGALLDEVVARWRDRAAARGLHLTGECRGALPIAVRGDAQLVGGILDALVDNALRFTPSGSVQLTLRLPLRDEGEEPALLYSVIDTGPGIPLELQASAFEAFVHEAGWGSRGQGAHFSLNTARRLMRFLGGNLELESTPGSGCRFQLSVPAGDLAGVEFALHPQAALPSAGSVQQASEAR